MNAYSCWEQRGDLDAGQIVRMTPITSSLNGTRLGTFHGCDDLSLSAMSQFGLFLEIKSGNSSQDVGVVANPYASLRDALAQWSDVHRSTPGLQRAATMAVSHGCQRMWERVCQEEDARIPQSLLMQLTEVCEFLEWNYALMSSALNAIVDKSDSDPAWRLDDNPCPKDACDQVLDTIVNETRRSGWQGLLRTFGGLPLFLRPGQGPTISSGAVGYGVGDMMGHILSSKAELQYLRDNVSFLRFCMAASYVETAVDRLQYLLGAQNFKHPQRFILTQIQPDEIVFLLQSLTSQRFSFLSRNGKLNFSQVAMRG